MFPLRASRKRVSFETTETTPERDFACAPSKRAMASGDRARVARVPLKRQSLSRESFFPRANEIRLGNLDGEFGSTFERQSDGEESVRGIADEFEKIRFRVVIHDVASRAQLGSDDLDDLTRK